MCNLGSLMNKVTAAGRSDIDEQGDFRPESEALEPDADIVDLTTVLLESEEVASRTLVKEDREYAESLERYADVSASCSAA